jgi:uncharacterized damage-inducible protein DinB
MPFPTPPESGEYGSWYAGYVGRVPIGADVLGLLARQQESTRARFAALSADRAAYRYAEGKWTVREVLAHLSDTERIMAYRALRVARGDTTPLPGFDENAYAPMANAEAHPIAALAEAWCDVRRATLSLFRHLPEDAWTRLGTASGTPISVRALAWIIAGHELHHLDVLAERYGLGPAPEPVA